MTVVRQVVELNKTLNVIDTSREGVTPSAVSIFNPKKEYILVFVEQGNKRGTHEER